MTSLNAFPEKFGIKLVGGWKDGFNITSFLFSDEFQNMTLEEISERIGKEDLLNISREYSASYNKYFDNASADFPSTVDSYWQVVRRKLPRPLLFGVGKSISRLEQDANLSARITQSLNEIVKIMPLMPNGIFPQGFVQNIISLDAEPDYKLESKSVHPQLGLNVYTFSGRGLSNYQTPFNYLSKEAPKIEIA